MIRFFAWRLHRRGLLGFSVAGLLISFFYGFAFISAAGTSAADQAAFGRSTTLLAKQFAFIIPVPVHPETLGGFEQYKWISGAIVMMMIWAALAGVGAGRGDESKGTVDQWLAAGVSRTRLLLARSAAYLLVLAVACFASVIGISMVAPLIQQDANVAGELGKALSMATGLFAIYAIALFVAQLPGERQTAVAFGVGVPVLLFVINGIADTVPSASGIGVVSPFHWLEKTSSAAPGGVFDLPGTIGLAVVALVFLGATIPLYARRDIGAGLFTWRRGPAAPTRTASRSPLLRMPFTEGLWEQRVGLAVWTAGSFFLGALMVSVVKSIVDALNADPHVAGLFSRVFGGASPYQSMLGFVWLSFSLLVLAGYAVVQVSRWSAQDQEGRLEMLLSVPVSRVRVVLERAIEFALASLALVAGGYIGVLFVLPNSGVAVDGGRVLLAAALLWPFALAFGGLGVALASRWPRIAVPALAAFAIIEYFLGDLAPMFKAPDWVANLSFFHLYGNPLTGDVALGPALWMLLVFVAGFAAAIFLMRRRDVAGA